MTHESNDAPEQQLEHRKEEGLTQIQRHDMQGPMRVPMYISHKYHGVYGMLQHP
ncbi:hypothetical protein E4U10_001963 [Claviceps purpurea]|nr:hypothetical protein E4U10_001963 [Claviceps purpurea]